MEDLERQFEAMLARLTALEAALARTQAVLVERRLGSSSWISGRTTSFTICVANAVPSAAGRWKRRANILSTRSKTSRRRRSKCIATGVIDNAVRAVER